MTTGRNSSHTEKHGEEREITTIGLHPGTTDDHTYLVHNEVKLCSTWDDYNVYATTQEEKGKVGSQMQRRDEDGQVGGRSARNPEERDGSKQSKCWQKPR